MRKIVFVRFYVFTFLMSFTSFALSCSAPQKEVRAYIEANPNWKMVEVCGYESCGPKVDHLKGKDIDIRLEVFKFQEHQFFVIGMDFMGLSGTYQFDPSKILIEVSNGKPLKPKRMSCNIPLDVNDLRLASALPGPFPIPIKEDDCFSLFFDHPAPPNDKELIMNFNKALTLNGEPVGIPLIYFRKNVAE
ncbi:MAG: hypothetical protein MCM46_18695 [Candidatus Manganitrophus sp. SB1]|nr:hypothetical protein [Candidatus Manganitrophus morganii]